MSTGSLELWPAPPGARLDQLLTSTASRFPTRTALVAGPTPWTYAELDRAVQQTAAMLHDHGVRPGDAVGLDCRNVAEFVISFYAISRAGGIAVPLNVLIGARLLADRLADCRAVLLVCVVGADDVPAAATARAAVERVDTCRGLVLVDAEHPLADLTADYSSDCSDNVPPASRGAGDAAVITYPRRDPGTPLGVVLSHAALLANAAAVTAVFSDHQPDPPVQLVALPLFHVVALTFQLNAGIASGATIVLLPRFEPVTALQAMTAERITHLVATPSMLWALAGVAEQQAGQADSVRSTVRLVSSQLAPLPPAVRKAVTATLGWTPLEGFGHSETGMVALHTRPGDDRPDSVGIPTPSWSTRTAGRCRARAPVSCGCGARD